jgi:hypothetical protein
MKQYINSWVLYGVQVYRIPFEMSIFRRALVEIKASNECTSVEMNALTFLVISFIAKHSENDDVVQGRTASGRQLQQNEVTAYVRGLIPIIRAGLEQARLDVLSHHSVSIHF